MGLYTSQLEVSVLLHFPVMHSVIIPFNFSHVVLWSENVLVITADCPGLNISPISNF